MGMQNDTDQTRSPGFLILDYTEPECAVECRDYDIIHNRWSELRGPVSSETGQEQDPDALSSLSPTSPTSTLYDTEGSLTDVLTESDAEDTVDTSTKGGKLIRAAVPGPLPVIDTSGRLRAANVEIPQGVWVPLTSESVNCVGYYAQVNIGSEGAGATEKWLTSLAMHIDTAGRNTWGLGQDYYVNNGGTVSPWGNVPVTDSQSFHTLIRKMRHDYTAAQIASGRERYADRSYASLFTVTSLPDRFRLPQWFRYSKERSWISPLIGSYGFGVADEVDLNIHKLRFDGAIGLGLQPFQVAFASSAVHLHRIPSFIAAIKNALPLVDTEGGHVLYFCLRRKDVPGGAPNEVPGGVLISKSWMSINNWPCEAVPKWSPPIPICSTDPKINEYLWKVELVSMAFGPLDKSQPDFLFIFPDGPIHVLFDTGSSGSWFPSDLVRYLRTTVFPIPENVEIDTERGSSSSMEDPERGPEYYIPRDINTVQWAVKLEFKGTDGRPLVVTCPAYPFLGCESTKEVVKTGYKEGLLFCSPESHARRFILGANFFQSMLVALHAPEYGDPYVRVAWPRANTASGAFVPPPIRRRG